MNLEKLRGKIIDKLNEYGVKIFSKYETEEDGGYCILCETLIIFLDSSGEEVSVSFRADTRPDESALFILIIQECVEKIENISVMESYIFDKNGVIKTGEAAYKFIGTMIESEIQRKIKTKKFFEDVLMNADCFEC